VAADGLAWLGWSGLRVLLWLRIYSPRLPVGLRVTNVITPHFSHSHPSPRHPLDRRGQDQLGPKCRGVSVPNSDATVACAVFDLVYLFPKFGSIWPHDLWGTRSGPISSGSSVGMIIWIRMPPHHFFVTFLSSIPL
jgi:hypothetical protein